METLPGDYLGCLIVLLTPIPVRGFACETSHLLTALYCTIPEQIRNYKAGKKKILGLFCSIWVVAFFAVFYDTVKTCVTADL